MKNISEATKITVKRMKKDGIKTTPSSVLDVFNSIIKRISGNDNNVTLISLIDKHEVFIMINGKLASDEDVNNAITKVCTEYPIPLEAVNHFFEKTFKTFVKVLSEFDNGEQFKYNGKVIVEIHR